MKIGSSTVVKKPTKIFIVCILYKILIELSYIYGISVFLDYSGIEIQFSMLKYLFSWMAFVVITGWSIFGVKSDYIGNINIILLVFSYIPTMSLWGIKKGIGWSGILVIFFYFIMMIIGCQLIQKILNVKKKNKNSDSIIFDDKNKKHYVILLLISVIIFFIMLLFHQMVIPNRWSLALSDSLSARLEARTIVIPTVFRYIYMITATAIAPILFVYSMAMNKKLCMLINLTTSYLAYLYNGMKTYILIYAFIIGIFILAKRKDSILDIIYKIIGGLSALWALGILTWKAIGNNFFLAYLHRMFTLPAEMHYYYYDFFSKNELIYLRDSVGRFWGTSPYTPSASRVIGKIYYFSETNNATNGLFSDFFANFGFVGLIVYPIIIFGVFWLLGKQLEDYSNFSVLSITFILLIVLMNNTFFTWLLTGGYIFSLILIRVIRRVKIRKI